MTSVVVTTRSCSARSRRERRTLWVAVSRRRSAPSRRRASRRSRTTDSGTTTGARRFRSAPRVLNALSLSREGAAPLLVAAPFMSFLRAGGSARSRLVTDAADRDHDLRALRILLDLGTQPLDVHVDEPRVGGGPVAPDLLQQHLPGEHLPWLPCQRYQQVELPASEVAAAPRPGHRKAGNVAPH